MSLAAGTMSYYAGNDTTTVDLPQPYYWWEFGAMLGAMLDYSHYTGDSTYDRSIATAMLGQVGPDYNYMLPKHYGDEGNDDLAFWGFAVMQAAENNFPQPNATIPSWLDMGRDIWGSLHSRWDEGNCSGGLFWQIFASNPNGLTYKNSIANGGFFQLSARLYRATGNVTYLEWAEKIWDWTSNIGLISPNWEVLDGADIKNNCTTPNQKSFSYTSGTYLYGAAVLSNTTELGIWKDRATKLIGGTKMFFSPFPNATNILYENACELDGSCNADMKSHKGYLSRFMYKSVVLMPELRNAVFTLMNTTVMAAANSCTGGPDGTTCGHRWWVGGYDNDTGLGQELTALETIQGLLAGQAAPPLKGDDIKTVRTFASNGTDPTGTTSSS